MSQQPTNKNALHETFGELKVVEIIEIMRVNKKGNKIKWRCRCSCGREVTNEPFILRKNKMCGVCLAKNRRGVR